MSKKNQTKKQTLTTTVNYFLNVAVELKTTQAVQMWSLQGHRPKFKQGNWNSVFPRRQNNLKEVV